MENGYKIVSLKDVDIDDASCGGGKFAGLAKIKSYVERFSPWIRLKLPETFAIPCLWYERYKKEGMVPEELVVQAMQCAVRLGGNVAVRSSADIEDQEGNTYSGVFESVLNVKNREQMREALNKVYASAKAVPEAQMGIIIQPMIKNPLMAGVVYSQAPLAVYNSTNYVVMNYVEGRYADKLLNNADDGNIFGVCKIVDSHVGELRLHPFNLCNSTAKIQFFAGSREYRFATDDDLKKYRMQFELAAWISDVEKMLGYPVDIEFVYAKDENIYVLQHRVNSIPRFKERSFGENIFTSFSQKYNVIAGKVTVRYIDRDISSDVSLGPCDNDVLCLIDKSSKAVSILSKQGYEDQKCVLAYADSIEGLNHKENIYRDNADLSHWIGYDCLDAFNDLEDGDYISVDLQSGKIKITKKKTPNVMQELAVRKIMLSR